MKKSLLAFRQYWLLPLLLLALFLAVRLPALGRFVTTDEALWLRRSANFYLALSNGQWADTFQSPHPGVVTMWAGAAAFQTTFPDYAQAGFPEIHDSQLLQLMENRGINPMEVLAAGRFALVLVHAATFLAAWPYARRLLGPAAASLGLALVALDPFVLAHQRLLHLDGLLASFMLLSLLAYLDFLRRGRLPDLAVSAVAAAFAWLTKTPAWFLLPAILALTAYPLWRSRPTHRQSPISNLKSPALQRQLPITSYRLLWLAPILWLLAALLVLFLLFPALWTAPLEIFGQMFGYALGSAEGEFSGPVFFNGVVYPDGELGAAGWLFYPISFLWRSTPLVLLGLISAAWFALRPPPRSRNIASPLTPLLLFSLAFIILMTIAGKKFDRYLLPALPPLMLIAGWGWVRLAESQAWLQRRAWRPLALIASVALLQLASALSVFPYYLSYYNPVLGGSARAPQAMMIGWGEGLDQAAIYLNERSVKADKAAAWYSVSVNLMSSAAVSDIPIALQLSQSELDALLAKEYLVIYIHQWQRGTPQNLLDTLAEIEPESRITINGLEYVRVYHLNGD